MKTAEVVPTGTKVRRAAETIIATLALIAATPAQARTSPEMAWGPRAPASVPTMKRQLPKITIAAQRDTIIAGLEDLVLTLTREGAVEDSLTVTLNLEQEQEWIHPMPYTATFAAGQATTVESITPRGMAAASLLSGDVVATVGSVAGYDTGDASATVRVIALGGPAAVAFVERSEYTFAEDAADARVTVVARMASGMPRGADVRFTVLAFDGSAVAAEDFEQILRPVTLREEDFVASNGRWEARRRVRLQLIDDDVREGTEYLRFFTGVGSGDSHGVAIGDSTGTPCPDCKARVEITDDEDIPLMQLAVNPKEIREEDEESSTATVSITNGKTFATDQTVTFAFAGTATEGSDYTVTPGDDDGATSGHQASLPAGTTSAGVTLTAQDDGVEDSNETIEVSATHGGEAIGGTQIIRILNQEDLPAITLTAERDTIIGSMEDLRLTLNREEPFDESLTVTVQLNQDQNWLSDTSRDVTFVAGESTAVLLVVHGQFATSVAESGNLIAAVDSVSGYDTSGASATVFVFSQEGPAVTVSFAHESYAFQEDAQDAQVVMVVKAADGMPRGTGVSFSVSTSPGTAGSPGDYEALSISAEISEEDYAFVDGQWQVQHPVPLILVDDDVREGTESLRMLLEMAPGQSADQQLVNSDGSQCAGTCQAEVQLADEEDIPELDLSVSEDEIREEEETSSTATVSITNGKSYAADQVVTFVFAGTATAGTDYTVGPADEDEGTPGHQVTLPADSTSVGVTLTAMDDDFEDSNEEIRISATHESETIGRTQTIRILNQEVLAGITLAAGRDTIIAGIENLELTLTREAPLDDGLTVTVQLAQDQDWLSDTSHDVTFAASDATAHLTLGRSTFSSSVSTSGDLTATLDAVSGYDTGDAEATVFVVSQLGEAIRAGFGAVPYTFAEDAEDPKAEVMVWTAAGMPRGATVTFSTVSRDGTATAGDDYASLSETITVREQDFRQVQGRWIVHHRFPVSLLDDDIREGTELFGLLLQPAQDHPSELLLINSNGTDCADPPCPHPIHITDDEDIPTFALSVNEDEIREEGETSATATVSITNGKSFAQDRMLTFDLGGDAIPGHDYSVTPTDADDGAGHQVMLPAGSSSVAVTFTAIDDDREEGEEKIALAVIHHGDAIGTGTIRIADRFPGPRVEITFEDVLPPRDRYTAGVATGPFTTRITFSEPVEGFTQEDISWSTHSLTTIDTTNIGVLVWDYAVIREGLEYTARMMPDQNGRLWISVHPGITRSVATGDGNQLGANSLWVDFPPNRMLVEPRALTVEEGDDVGADFLVLLTSEPTGPVTVTVTGMDGTALEVDRPTVKFTLPYWNGGWGITVTAGHDANTRDETVRLNVTPSGGGYDGRTATVVVAVRDDDRAGGDVDDGSAEDEAAALALLQDVSPETAASALFGEADLSEAQIAALDLLGNGNGRYDVGDLLSWIERCRRAEASSGRSPSPDSNPIPGAAGALAATGRIARNGQRLRRSARSRTRRGSTNGSLLWLVVVLLLATITFWGCRDGDGLVDPRTAEPDPGYLKVRLTAPPAARDIGAMLVVEGPGIDSVRAPGLELFRSEASSPQRIIVAGTLATGPIAEFHVPDRTLRPQYRVRLLEVTGEDYSLRDLAEYGVAINR